MIRTKRFGLILNDEERKLICQLAKYDGIWSQATMVRRIIYEAARVRGLWPQGYSHTSADIAQSSLNQPSESEIIRQRKETD
jgi:hypothetical protein